MKKFTSLLLLMSLLVSASAFAQNTNSARAKSPIQESVKFAKVSEKNITETRNGLISVSHNKPGVINSNQTDDAIIRYDNGVNFTALGINYNGTLKAAAYFPASTMAQYVGLELKKVEMYVNSVPLSCKIKIYGPGSATTPGIVLYQQDVVPVGLSWNIFELTTPVTITGGDIWISYEVTQLGGESPCGCDVGPAITGRGDMIGFDNGTWFALTYYGLNYNWNIAGHLFVAGGIGAANDVGVQTILSPVTGTNLEIEVVKIRVKNFGTGAQSNIPVFYTLDGGTAISGTIAGPLECGATFDYTFQGTVNLGTVGQTYLFNACTALEGDEVTRNDCKISNVIHLSPAYCDASTTSQIEYIANVSCGAISNSSGWQGGVADFTALNTTIAAGGEEIITITNENFRVNDKAHAWVDWNNDFTFGPGNELILMTDETGTGQFLSGIVAVPQGTAPGEYRMRIRLTYIVPPVACGNAVYGEIEDYTIIVIPQSANDVGLQSLLSPVSGTNLGNEIVKIRIKNYGTVSQSNIPVFYTVDGGPAVTGIIAGPLESGESYDYTFEGTVDLGVVGQTYNFNSCTTLAGDEFTGNDCKTAIIANLPPIPPDYCEASTSHDVEFIDNVLCGSINNSSYWQSGVADYTDISTTIEAGASQTITITNGDPFPTDKVTVWIDWNQDLIFGVATVEEYVLTNVGGTGATFSGNIAVPFLTGGGDYRMRIRLTYNNTPNPCGPANYGEIEDYTIHVIPLPTHDAGVQIILSPVSGPNLGNEIVKIRIKNFGTARQNNIPVFFSIDGGTAVSGVIEGPLDYGETYDYTFAGSANLGLVGHTYLINACTALEGDEVTGNNCKTASITNEVSDYCDAFTLVQHEFISKVQCGTINKTSGWQSGVADYTAISTTIEVGTSKPITITNGNARAGESVTAWIDWDKNLTFDSGFEEIVLTNVGGTGQTFTGTVAVPLGTSADEYRMRIRMTYNENPTPCGYANYGEIEDYTIDVFVQPTNDVGVLSVLSPISGYNLLDQIVTIRVKNFGTSPQTNIPVSYSLDGSNLVTGIIKGPVGRDETIDYTFNGFVNLGNPGQTYSFITCTNLDGDESAGNDCKTSSVWNYPNPPYSDCSTTTEDEYIANVLFGTINNSSGWQGGVADYTALYNTLETGTSDSITITNGNAWASDYVTVWVDWNYDYEFGWVFDNEVFPLTNVGGTGEIFTGNIQVPDGQASGAYRMRIRMT